MRARRCSLAVDRARSARGTGSRTVRALRRGMHRAAAPADGKVGPLMEAATFCRESRVLLVVGKGGVGKTTVTAALARLAETAGLTVLVIALDDGGALPRLLGHPEAFAYEEAVLGPRLSARTITADAALLAYLADHGLGRVSKRLLSSGMIDVVSTAIPGIREVLVLGRLKQLERDGVADLVVLDAPATGHAVTFLTSPRGLLDAARGGPLRAQAEEVVELLQDPSRCQVLLVTIPEETPINEAIETAYRLEDEVGVALGPIVVNGCYPALSGLDTDPLEAARQAGLGAPDAALASRLRAAASFRTGRARLQEAQVARLSQALAITQLRLPYLFTAGVGKAEIDVLAKALAEQVSMLPEPAGGTTARPA